MLKESKRVKVKTQRRQRTSKSNQILLKSINSSISIINAVTNSSDKSDNELTKKPDKAGVKGQVDNAQLDDIYTQFATLFTNPNTIMMPTKVKILIERNLPKPMLDKIHGGVKTILNREVAVELCLLFLSQLSSTYRNILNGRNPEGWKSLRADYLRELLWIEPKTYQYVIEALKYEFREGPILERGFYVMGEHSYEFRLGEGYRGKGFVAYPLTTITVKNLFKKSCERKLKKAKNNAICLNLLEFYKTIVLPTKEEIEDEADILIKAGYKKKGKKLIRRNKKSDNHHGDTSKISFVEDSLKIYDYLTKIGLMIPKYGNERSGGRIVDSFVLMPSWIRKLVKINGKPIAEADYSCLHPNIAMSLYGGNTQYLTHGILANQLVSNEGAVKIEHLSFFNKEVWQMKKSPLFDYYHKYEPSMLEAIIKEKNKSEFGNKITSRRLFAKEVEIMTEVVSRLNEEGIFVGYIYDALFFDPVYKHKVVKVMNEVAVDLGVFTTAELKK